MRVGAALLVAGLGCRAVEPEPGALVPFPEPLRNAEGCWLDPYQAFQAIRVYECSRTDECLREDRYGCDSIYAERIAAEETGLCFDGCKVDACLDELIATHDSCPEEYDPWETFELCLGDDGAFRRYG